jgi:hypothetical protein
VYYTLQREAAKHGIENTVLIIIHPRRKWRSAIEFLSISVLPEDDPVGSKHVAPHFNMF